MVFSKEDAKKFSPLGPAQLFKKVPKPKNSLVDFKGPSHDAIDWAASLDWENKLRAHWGCAKAPSSASALSGALPFCALNQEPPDWLAQQLTPTAAQKALRVSLLWKNPLAAKTLCQTHPKLDVADALAWAQKKTLQAHKENSNPKALAKALEGMEPCASALELARALPDQKGARPKTRRSL